MVRLEERFEIANLVESRQHAGRHDKRSPLTARRSRRFPRAERARSVALAMDDSPIATFLGPAIQLGITFGLVVWARAVARGRTGVAWRVLPYLPIAAFLVWTAGTLVSIVQLNAAFDAVSEVDPSQKAQALSDRIQSAMITTAIGLAIGASLYLASFVMCVLGSFKPRPT
jgi:hypothetical protein